MNETDAGIKKNHVCGDFTHSITEFMPIWFIQTGRVHISKSIRRKRAKRNSNKYSAYVVFSTKVRKAQKKKMNEMKERKKSAATKQNKIKCDAKFLFIFRFSDCFSDWASVASDVVCFSYNFVVLLYSRGSRELLFPFYCVYLSCFVQVLSFLSLALARGRCTCMCIISTIIL